MFSIGYIIRNKGENELIIGISIAKFPDYQPGENLRLGMIEVERAMMPRTELRRLDLIAFRLKRDNESGQLQVGQRVVINT